MNPQPTYYLLPFLLFFIPAKAQSLPDSIFITEKIYTGTPPNWNDTLYRTFQYLFVKKDNKYVEQDGYNCLPNNFFAPLLRNPKAYMKYKGVRIDTNTLKYHPEKLTALEEDRVISMELVEKLMNCVNNAEDKVVSLHRFGIDTAWIKENPEKVLQLTKFRNEYHWNEKQRSLIVPELTNITNYKTGLNEYLKTGDSYTMHNGYKRQYTISCYTGGKLTNTLTSRQVVWGYKSPWSDENGRLIFDDNLDRTLGEILDLDVKLSPPLTGMDLLTSIANRIIELHGRALNPMEMYSYETEINELKPAFQIISVNRLTGHGAYWGDGNQMQIMLHNDQLLPNVKIELMLSKIGETLYTRDSLLVKSTRIIDKVQSNPFIRNYLLTHPNDSLKICFFNDKPINPYNIESINKFPKQWSEYDETVKREEASKYYKPEYSNRKFEHLYCSCNYRFGQDFIEQGIILLLEEKGGHSRWVLLPDNTILCYYLNGHSLMGQEFPEYNPYPCLRYNEKGEILAKETYPPITLK